MDSRPHWSETFHIIVCKLFISYFYISVPTLSLCGQVRYNDPSIHLIEQDYLIWYHENKSVMWHVSSSAPCKYNISKYLHFSRETEIGTMDDGDSNAVRRISTNIFRKWTYEL